jgi:ATP-binding cassette subfamily B protein
MGDIVNKGISTFDTRYIWQIGGLMVIIAIGGTVCAVLGTYISSQIATGMCTIMRADIFKKVQNFSLHEFDTISSASLITRTTNDTNQIQGVMVMIFNLVVTAPITLVVGIMLALRQDVGLAWVLVAIMPLLVVFIGGILFRSIPLFGVMQIKLDKLNLILDENLTGVRVVRAFNRIKHEEDRFDLANHDVTNIAIRVNQIMAMMMPVMMLLINVSSVAIIWFGSQRVVGNHLEIGAMFSFLQYAFQILFSLLMVAVTFVMIPRAEASAVRINEVFAMEPEITDPKKPA